MPAPRRRSRPTLDERVAAVRQKLARANTRAATWLALTGADRETLRRIEVEYFHHPGPFDSIVRRIADGHLEAVARLGLQAASTAEVTPDIVALWAADTLADYLPGQTDFHMKRGGQFLIAAEQAARPEEGECPPVFTVTTVLGLDPRRFRVSISVTEVD